MTALSWTTWLTAWRKSIMANCFFTREITQNTWQHARSVWKNCAWKRKSRPKRSLTWKRSSRSSAIRPRRRSKCKIACASWRKSSALWCPSSARPCISTLCSLRARAMKWSRYVAFARPMAKTWCTTISILRCIAATRLRWLVRTVRVNPHF